MVTTSDSISPDEDIMRADSIAREIFSEVANKWALLIIETLGERTLRFSEVRDALDGISHKMLTQNLRMLERNGLVTRTVHPTVPPKVEYALTGPGRELRATVDLLCSWTRTHLRHIDRSRQDFAAKPSTAEAAEAAEATGATPAIASPTDTRG
ncbi:helix-turn-helix domain-containing protein [Microcella daejeonensis]|uniref:Helix-turn-helix domain-containing protein n=1 Tax=Microcella daejeonensis TaxID=2994971 RepID=A0A9E8MMQ6_9MICO|nr:helix-turn-helix domain-containing protein [Microcella daejeonensis]WAB82513.1 helix-turn-helix domain-containing protein [Microcella daejeonensis]